MRVYDVRRDLANVAGEGCDGGKRESLPFTDDMDPLGNWKAPDEFAAARQTAGVNLEFRR